ncbi:MAG: hypothetical protein RIR53_418 [Bacteroidota bacterium]|jgi:mRNA interferase MazF
MGMKRPLRRGDVYWVNLDPTVGTEIRKTRPAVIISPEDMNTALPRVIIAPLTTTPQTLGCRPSVNFKRKRAYILLDQLRTVDKQRLGQYMGSISPDLWHGTLLEMLG